MDYNCCRQSNCATIESAALTLSTAHLQIFFPELSFQNYAILDEEATIRWCSCGRLDIMTRWWLLCSQENLTQRG